MTLLIFLDIYFSFFFIMKKNVSSKKVGQEWGKNLRLRIQGSDIESTPPEKTVFNTTVVFSSGIRWMVAP
ncbi:hypothetical protein DESC_240082 [Desulfosarcina cetonica]|nr:hypothetical protein DESC_240082 [Desulfosarcina cetonica]